MKRILKVIISFVLISAILIPTLIFSASAENATILYARNALEKMTNSDSLVFAYDEIYKSVSSANTPENITINDGDKGITKDELKMVVTALVSDHPELFWVEKKWSYSTASGSNIVKTAKISYYIEGAALETAKTEFNAVVAELLRGLDGKTEYQKAKILHDRLALHTEYVIEGFHQTAYGALVDKKAVCAGYATAYQHLLHAAGMDAWTISGESYNPISNSKVRHEWNLVKIDGNYYFTDVTWDDMGSTVNEIYYLYFNTTSADIESTHLPAEVLFADNLPDCISTEANYFANSNAVYTSFDVNKVAKQLKDNGMTAVIYVDGDVNKFVQDFANNIQSVAEAAGAKLMNRYAYRKVGNEVHLTLESDCSHAGATKQYDEEYHWNACVNCGSFVDKDIHRYSGESTKCTACDYSYTVDAPETPDITDKPTTPETPDVSDKPTTPETPDVTDKPTTPETPDVSDKPTTPEAPEKPEEATVSVEIKNNRGTKTINYGDVLKFTAEYKKPEDATVCWYINGEKAATGDKFELEGLTDVEISVKLVDSSNNVLKDENGQEISDTEKVTVKAGFFQKLISFFKNLFSIDRSVVQ